MLSGAKYLSDILLKNQKMESVKNYYVMRVNDPSTANEVEEKKVNVDGFYINYVRTGKGEHAVLLLPGMLGAIWTDFQPQIEYLNNEQLTIIAWDPPGYGKSRPPNRTFPKKYYERDSTLACNLMKILGFDKFSIMGWSDGAVTCLVFAAMYPENVQKVIAVAPHAFILPDTMDEIEGLRNLNNWAPRYRLRTTAVYGEKYFQDTINIWIDAKIDIVKNDDGDVCKGYLSKIKCPILFVFGDKDKLIPTEQIDYLQANVAGSKLVIIKDAHHDPHLRNTVDFNTVVHEFLLDLDEENNCSKL